MNKLREKLMPYASGYIGSSMLTNTEYPEQIDKNTDELEQITDDFSVKLLKWYNELLVKGSFDEIDRTEEELQQYFKENVYGK
jgi:hypothetical protein